METINEYERNGCTVEIYYDQDPENPRKAWDNFGTMICSHGRYILGDEQFDPDDYGGWDDLKKHLIEDLNAVIVLPLGLYDHSGITMYIGNTHDRWDGGQVGFIYATQEQVNDEFDGNLKRAEECLKGEVKTYDEYLTGDVFGFIVRDKVGEEIDSCWGFYGGVESAEDEANSVADHYEHPHDAAYAKGASKYHA